MKDTSEAGPAAADAPTAKRRRPWRHRIRAVVIAFEIAGILVIASVAFLAIALLAATDNRVRLPEGIEKRVEAALDASLATHDVGIEEVAIALPDGRFRPEIVLSGVSFRDEDGLRAYLPTVSVVIDGPAILRGDVRLQRVRLDGGGLRLSRAADGIIDIAVGAEAGAAGGGIPDRMARLDALLAQPLFADMTEVSGDSLVLVMTDALSGRLIQSHDADLMLTRPDGGLSIAVSGTVAATRRATIEIAFSRAPGTTETEARFAFANIDAGDIAVANPALAWLEPVRAPISGTLTARLQDDGQIGDMAGWLEIGAGDIALGSSAPVPIDRVRADLSYDAAQGRLSFGSLDVTAPSLSFRAEGQADLGADGRNMVGQVRLSDVRFAREGVFETPLAFAGGAVDFRLMLGPDFALDIGQAVLYDGPLQVALWGGVHAEPEGLVTRLDARMEPIAARDVLLYWPQFAIPGTRTWVLENLRAGHLHGVAASLRAGPDGRQGAVRFDFDGMELSVLDGMPPITAASGYFSVTGERLALHITEGQIEAPVGGSLDLSGSTMLIEDARPRNPEARFDLQVVGALEAVGSLLALPPVSLFAATDLDPESFATGQAEARVGLEFRFQRAVPRDEIAFSATGTLREVRAEGLLPGRTLTAEALDLTVTPEVVALAGRGAIDGVPFTGRWSQVLGADADGSSRAEARVALNAATLARFGVDLPPGSVSGSGGADVAVTLPPDGPASISIRSDLAGLGLAVPSLGWRLSQPATGDLAAVVTLGPQLAIPELRLEAAGLAIDASVAFDPGGGAQVALASARVGSWADIRGAVRVPAGGAAPSLRLEGGRIDLTALPGGGPGGGSGGGGQGMAITGRLDRVTLADGIDLTGVTADLDPRLAGTFAASVNGAASLSGEIRPTDGRLAVQISAPDAGAVLRAAGLFENAYGGALVLTLTPAGPPGSFTGRLDIDGARLRDAPAMAELLNAISVVGLLEQLTAEGINLGEIEAQFRIVPGAIVLDQGTAVGPSLGLSLDGVYDTATGSYDMQGVISPFYFVNGAFGAIFAQRREGLVGVTYRIIGSPEGAEVRVNPLSILTPGIFREIFRRPPPQVIQSE